MSREEIGEWVRAFDRVTARLRLFESWVSDMPYEEFEVRRRVMRRSLIIRLGARPRDWPDLAQMAPRGTA